MSEYRTIEIDFEIHKRIEAARLSFSETPAVVLRRLLGIEDAAVSFANSGNRGVGRAWSWKGLILPHGTELRMEYNGRTHEGVVLDGEWHVEGTIYKSPSAAAVGVAKTKAGNPVTALDGWIYWAAKLPNSSKWINISALKNSNQSP